MEINVWWSAAAAAAIALSALGLCVRALVVQRRRLDKLDDRLAHLTAGLSLLTDTVEGGLRDVALEIGRLSAVPAARKPKAHSATQRRVATAARRGRSVQDIAANEEMSESEVRLRLQMANAAREKAHAEMR